VNLATSELEAGLDELAALVDAGAGRLAIGALALPRARIVPDALARFAVDYPTFRVSVTEGAYAELISELRTGAVDLVVGALRNPPPSPDLVQEALFVDDLFIVARAGHPLAGPQAPAPEDLARFPWVVGARGAPMRAIWESLFKDRAHPATWVASPSTFLARRLLIQGDWLALMSLDQFSLEGGFGLLAAVGPALPGSGRRIGVTTRQDWRPTAAQAAFLDALRAVSARPAPHSDVGADIRKSNRSSQPQALDRSMPGPGFE
jgi:DNA-binding transcriptional LysR family regulator